MKYVRNFIILCYGQLKSMLVIKCSFYFIGAFKLLEDESLHMFAFTEPSMISYYQGAKSNVRAKQLALRFEMVGSRTILIVPCNSR